MSDLLVRLAGENDKLWRADLLKDLWGSVVVVSRGRLHDAVELPAFIAETDGERAGIIVYELRRERCEIVAIASLVQEIGAGTALIEEVRAVAREHGCREIWLITTNDNTPAMHFYQRRGFHFVAVHRDTIEESRRLKPAIPLVGINGIPIRDEIEMSMEI